MTRLLRACVCSLIVVACASAAPPVGNGPSPVGVPGSPSPITPNGTACQVGPANFRMYGLVGEGNGTCEPVSRVTLTDDSTSGGGGASLSETAQNMNIYGD